MTINTLIINRRDLPEHLMHPEWEGLEETAEGVIHGGFDCFVFRRDLLDHFERNMVCLGVVFLGWALMFNLFTKAKKCAFFTNARITYHFGDDERPVTNENSDLRLRNTIEHQSLVARLLEDPKGEAFLNAYCAYVDRIDQRRQKVPNETRIVLENPKDRPTFARTRAVDLKPHKQAVTQIRTRTRQRLFLHIGKPKTATSLVQGVAKANRAALAEHGLIIPDFFQMPTQREEGFEPLLKFLKSDPGMHLWAPFALTCLPEAARRLGVPSNEMLFRFVKQHLEDAKQKPDHDILISHESLAAPKLETDALAALLEGFDVTIIMSVRRFDDWIESRYRQDLRGFWPAHWNPNTSPFVTKLNQWSPTTVLEGLNQALPDADVLLLDYETEKQSGALVERFFEALGQKEFAKSHVVHPSSDRKEALVNVRLSARSDLFLKLLHQHGVGADTIQHVVRVLREKQDADVLKDPEATSIVPVDRLRIAHQRYNLQVAELRALYRFPGNVAQSRPPRKTTMGNSRAISTEIASLISASLSRHQNEDVKNAVERAYATKPKATPALFRRTRRELIVLAGQSETNIPALQKTAAGNAELLRAQSGIVFADLGQKGPMHHDAFFQACLSDELISDVRTKLKLAAQSVPDHGALLISDYRLMFPGINYGNLAQITEGFDVSVVALLRRTDEWLEDRWIEMLKSPMDMPSEIENSFLATDIDKFAGLQALRDMRQAMPDAKITSLSFDANIERGLTARFFSGLGVKLPKTERLANLKPAKAYLTGLLLQEARRANATPEMIKALAAAARDKEQQLFNLQTKMEKASETQFSLLPETVRENALTCYNTSLPALCKDFGYEPGEDLKTVSEKVFALPGRPDLQRAYNVIAHVLDAPTKVFMHRELGLQETTIPTLATTEPRQPASGGEGRKVIAFSLFGTRPEYRDGARANAMACHELFPDWTCRIYVSNDAYPTVVKDLDGLDVELIQMEQHTAYDGLAWRFLPAVDPDVDVFISRDIDTIISERDRAAVDDWLASDKAFHVIRDHPSHTFPMLAGLWGARWRVLDDLQKILDGFSKSHGTDYRTWDQDFLAHCIYPGAKASLHVNSEFICFDDENPEPIPHERDGNIYLGLPFGRGETTSKRLEAFAQKKHMGLIKRDFGQWSRKNMSEFTG